MGQNYVDWNEKYSVGINEIDKQHKKLLDFTNDLYNACGKGKDDANELFKVTIKKAVDYVHTHFAYEENLMKQYNYPDYIIHKKQHEEFIRKILEEVKKFQTGALFVPNSFVRFLRDWTLEHIAIVDKKYQKHLNNCGVN